MCVGLLGCAGGSGPNTTAVASLGDGTDDGNGTTTASVSATDSDGGQDDLTGGESMTSTTGSGSDSGDDVDPDSDSSGGAASCETNPAACTAWLLAPGGGSWVAMDLDSDSPMAPSEPVLAAFDIEDERIGFAITAARVHELDLVSRQWVGSRNRDDVMPELAGQDVLVGYTVPSHWSSKDGQPGPTEGASFLTATDAFNYQYTVASGEFSFVSSVKLPATTWGSAGSPEVGTVRASWIDVLNGDGWANETVEEACGMPSPTGPYQAVVATNSVHLIDAGYCFMYFDPLAYDDFSPFGLPGAPAGSDIGGALYSETMGVWLFRGT